jgi:predicted O-linked N-acetylglucosamine transferase (SPINDLY family)
MSKSKKIDPPDEVYKKLFNLYNNNQHKSLFNKTSILIGKYPKSTKLWNLKCVASLSIGNIQQAVIAFDRSIQIDPLSADSYYNLGIALQKMGNYSDAVINFKQSIRINPNYIEAYGSVAKIYEQDKDFDNAIYYYKKILSQVPDYAEVLNNIANLKQKQGHSDTAIDYYNKALNIRPNYVDARCNLGNTLKSKGQFVEAIYNYKKALEINPDCVEAYNSLGNIFTKFSQYDNALGYYQKALEINPNYSDAHLNLGIFYKGRDDLELSITHFKKALTLNPLKGGINIEVLHLKRQMCDWADIDYLAQECIDLDVNTNISPPFEMLSIEDNPYRQMMRSISWGRAMRNYPFCKKTNNKNNNKIRVGYFSADIHNHATMYLMAGLFREHDTSKYEIYVYSYGDDRHDECRKHAQDYSDAFFDIKNQSDQQVKDLVLEHHLDIAVDLKGYTKQTRSEFFSFRLAPLQFNFLGYPGTMGVDFIDYIIADKIVISESEQKNYTESIAYMPDTYQPNDNKRRISDIKTTRSDFNLPESGFVFCCFNSNYKISSREYEIWMRILKEVKGSVLWLFKSNKWANNNLLEEAKKRGISQKRIIFADKVPPEAHLERHGHIDLFIDTFNYNAHTTASDALWAGVPIVTKKGKQFSACVAASLLHSIGLDELITTTESEYENLIIDLAKNKEQLERVKRQLANNRDIYPLFDTKQYVKNLEKIYRVAYDRYLNNKACKNICL